MAANLFSEKIKEKDFQYLIRWVKFQTDKKQTFQLDVWDIHSKMSIFSMVASCFAQAEEGNLARTAEVKELLYLLMSACNTFTFPDLEHVLRSGDQAVINDFISTLIKKKQFMLLDQTERSKIKHHHKKLPLLDSFLSMSQMAGNNSGGLGEADQMDLMGYEVMACALVKLVHLYRQDPDAELVSSVLDKTNMASRNIKSGINYTKLLESLSRLTEPNLRIAARYIFSPPGVNSENGTDLACLFSPQVSSLAKEVLG